MSEPHAPGREKVRHPLPAELVHDLRTPLTQIIGYSEMLLERAHEAGHDGYAADLRKVADAGYRMLALITENLQPVRPADLPEADAGSFSPDLGG